ncbi:MAG: HAMP domain-containing sensor histidine kinase [Bdellovibrionota bacterium]
MKNSNSIFKTSRDNTDESLDAEREKASASIESARMKVEEKSDSDVASRRSETDEAVSAARGIADSAAHDGSIEEMQTERDLSDQSIRTERLHIDAVLVRERKQKSSIVDDMLEGERTATDQNLSSERLETDSEVDRATLRLTTERAEHTRTKGTLTSREEILGIVSHDLRNPIGAASSCAEMLLEDPDYTTQYSEPVRTWLELIKRNVDLSLRLIADLLDVERFSQGNLELKVGTHGLDEILREAIETCSYAGAAKSILLRSSPTKFSGDVVCDRDRILQVLGNLIGNAIKFTAEGGSVTVDAKRTATGIELSVKDSGIGISEEKQKNIYDRYAQIEAKDRRGLGLGLYITKMLVEAHGGKIWVDSKVGHGSTFYVSLPQAPIAARPLVSNALGVPKAAKSKLH